VSILAYGSSYILLGCMPVVREFIDMVVESMMMVVLFYWGFGGGSFLGYSLRDNVWRTSYQRVIILQNRSIVDIGLVRAISCWNLRL
jgi:hypothetical protein